VPIILLDVIEKLKGFQKLKFFKIRKEVQALLIKGGKYVTYNANLITSFIF